MKINTLVEDTKKEGEFESEHGLSIYFEEDGKRFIFDLGQSNMFLRNAKRLNINLNDIDYLIFSHGHYDHMGGLPFFHANNKTKIIAHPHALIPKYDGKRYIGYPQKKDDLIMQLEEKPLKLINNVWFLGQIPGERKTNLGHYIKDDVKHKDFLLDDTALVINRRGDMIIIAGCAHSGIVNIVKYATELFPKKDIIIVGGFHMLKYSNEEIQKTIEELKKLGVNAVYPGHCTGNLAIRKLLDNFSGERLYSGMSIEV